MADQNGNANREDSKIDEAVLMRFSGIVFRHNLDKWLQPCIVIRFGSACAGLRPASMLLFPDVVAYMVKDGLRKADRVTLLIDCDNLSPLRFPMKLMMSYSTLLREHFLESIENIVIVRISFASRILLEPFVEDLKPGTKQKVQFLGVDYQNVLPQFIQIVPAFLGSDCTCGICEEHRIWEENKRAKRKSKSKRDRSAEVELFGNVMNAILLIIGIIIISLIP